MDANDLTPVVTSYRVRFKIERGAKSDGGYKKLHVNPRVYNESLLRLPSSLALTTRNIGYIQINLQLFYDIYLKMKSGFLTNGV